MTRLVIVLLIALARPLTATAQTVATFTIGSDAVATALTAGTDGNVWFTYRASAQRQFGVGRITPDGTALDLFGLSPSSGTSQFGDPDSIAAGLNGIIYAGQNVGPRSIVLPVIFRVAADGSGGQLWEVDAQRLGGLAVDPVNRVLWFTSSTIAAGNVALLSIGQCPPLSCQFFRDTEDPFPVDAQPGFVTLLDMNAWYTDLGNARIVRVTAGSLRFDWVAVPNLHRPFDITAGPDGNIWFTESVFGYVGRLTPSFQITEFPVSTRADRIAAGPDQVLYFTVSDRAVLGRMTPDGSVTEFPAPQPLSAITGGPVGKIWAADALGHLYRFDPPPACAGDCNRGLSVTVDEIVRLVDLALSGMPPDTCALADVDGNNRITVDELLQAVDNALGGCP